MNTGDKDGFLIHARDLRPGHVLASLNNSIKGAIVLANIELPQHKTSHHVTFGPSTREYYVLVCGKIERLLPYDDHMMEIMVWT